MDALLLILALALQAADAGYTCRQLGRGGRELNPLLGQSCARVVGMKAAALGVTPLIRHKVMRRVYLGSLAAGGAVGVTFSIRWSD